VNDGGRQLCAPSSSGQPEPDVPRRPSHGPPQLTRDDASPVFSDHRSRHEWRPPLSWTTPSRVRRTRTFTARSFKASLAELGGKHRRGGYRDPESQAFIESWFGKLKEREVWLNEYEILDDARQGIGRYVDRYHHWPPLGPELPDARRGRPDLGGSTRTTKTRDLACQHRRGARHTAAKAVRPSVGPTARSGNHSDHAAVEQQLVGRRNGPCVQLRTPADVYKASKNVPLARSPRPPQTTRTRTRQKTRADPSRAELPAQSGSSFLYWFKKSSESAPVGLHRSPPARPRRRPQSRPRKSPPPQASVVVQTTNRSR
jgi:hypothetical protein